jgi:hypothetical protein
VGDAAFDHGVRVHELFNKVATLEEAFLERTAGAEEFQAREVVPDQVVADPAQLADEGSAP